MVVDAKARRIYNFTSTKFKFLGEIGGILSWAQECENSREAFERIFSSNEDGIMKGLKFTVQTGGIASRVLLQMATGLLSVPLFTTKVLSYGLPQNLRNQSLSRIQETESILNSINISWKNYTTSDDVYSIAQIEF